LLSKVQESINDEGKALVEKFVYIIGK